MPDLAAMPVHPDPATSSPTIASFCASYHRIVSAAEELRGRHAEIAKQFIHWVDGSTPTAPSTPAPPAPPKRTRSSAGSG